MKKRRFLKRLAAWILPKYVELAIKGVLPETIGRYNIPDLLLVFVESD
jgi:hypothetical protein